MSRGRSIEHASDVAPLKGKRTATAGRAPRVALVASYAPSLTLFRGPLIAELVARGHPVLCLAPDLDDPTFEALKGLGAECAAYPLDRTGLSPGADLGAMRALTCAFRDWRPDVVMGYTPKPAIYASLAARVARVPRIVPMVTGLGYAFLDGGGARGRLIGALMKGLYRIALSASHGVIFHNRDDHRLLAQRGALPRGLDVHIVAGSGVDLEAFPEAPLPPLGEGLVFLMIARLVRYKGVREYCEAARRVRERGGRARFLLVGPPETGPARFPESELARYAGVVDYLGPRDDIRALLAGAHVYVLPSYGEGMPRTVLEALATGRPVITTDARGCRETVDERVNGILVPKGEAEPLADAMAWFLQRPDMIASMGHASRRKAERRFDVRRINRQMLAALGLRKDG